MYISVKLVYCFLVSTRLPVEGNEDSSSSLGVIIGASAGGALVLLIIVLVITCCCCMGRRYISIHTCIAHLYYIQMYLLHLYLFRSRSGSYTPRGIFKNTAIMRSSFRGSFSRKNEPALIGMDSESMDREPTTFQMYPVSTKPSNIRSYAHYAMHSILFNPIGKRSRSNSPTPISLKDFSVHVAAMHRGKNHGFEIEYEVCVHVAIYKTRF